jgi:hypothetical protein
MSDKFYRNIKTGERKPLPLKVYEAVKKNWVPVDDVPEEYADYKDPETVHIIVEEKAATSDPEIKENLDILQQIVSEESADESDPEGEPDKEALQAEYEKLSGEKPDGV